MSIYSQEKKVYCSQRQFSRENDTTCRSDTVDIICQLLQPFPHYKMDNFLDGQVILCVKTRWRGFWTYTSHSFCLLVCLSVTEQWRKLWTFLKCWFFSGQSDSRSNCKDKPQKRLVYSLHFIQLESDWFSFPNTIQEIILVFMIFAVAL